MVVWFVRQRYINKQIGHVPCDEEQRNAIVILMQFVPSCIVCLDEINPIAHPIMGGNLEVLHKIKNYLQLIKLKPQPSPPALLIPSSLIIRDLISSLTSNLRGYIYHVTKITTL